MRPVIEYANRIGYFKEALKLPLSLFLQNIWDDRHTVLVINNHYGKDDCLTVRHWDIANVNKNNKMPPCKESVIPKGSLFDSELVILEDYRTMEYFYEDYECLSGPEGVDTQQWVEEEQEEYRYLMSRYYFSIEHQIHREETLWHYFMDGYINKSYNMYLRSMPFDTQQCIIQEAGPDHWRNWLLWRKYILDFPSKVAPELTFCEAFEKKLKGNTKYQELMVKETLKTKEEEEAKWSQTISSIGDYNSEYGGTFTLTTGLGM